jgi:hypothetical protein
MMERFRHGNCQDACVGTLLAAVGVEDPAALLFRRLIFRIRKHDHVGPPTIDYATRDYFGDITKATGVELAYGIADNGEDLLALIDELLGTRVPVAVSVDHYAYPRSQYCGLAHRPHFVILAVRSGNRYRYVDPFPRYDLESSVTRDGLERWCRSPISPREERHRYIYVRSAGRTRFQADAYRRAVWTGTLSENVQSMLSAPADHAAAGVAAIRRLAVHLTDALDRSVDDAARLLSTMPDVGASRLEHGRWLETGGRLVGSVAASKAGTALQQIARQWDLLAAVAQEHDIAARSGQPPRPFLLKKLKGLPELVSSVADREEQAMYCLADAL